MTLRKRAEGLILQAMEDLYDSKQREDCLAFFRSGDFEICAEMARIDMAPQVRILDLVKRVIRVSPRHQVRYKEKDDLPPLNRSRCKIVVWAHFNKEGRYEQERIHPRADRKETA
jgi:hypothetical protein